MSWNISSRRYGLKLLHAHVKPIIVPGPQYPAPDEVIPPRRQPGGSTCPVGGAHDPGKLQPTALVLHVVQALDAVLDGGGAGGQVCAPAEHEAVVGFGADGHGGIQGQRGVGQHLGAGGARRVGAEVDKVHLVRFPASADDVSQRFCLGLRKRVKIH